jgi:hypothetical protein
MSEKFSLPETAEIRITLPISLWRIVARHLRCGVCNDVYDALTLIYMQFDLQVREAQQQAEAAMRQAQYATARQEEAPPVQAPPADTAEQASKTAAAAKLH